MDEPVFLAPETRIVLHDYDEDFSANTKVYQLSEIVAEKYRALFQSLERLRNKGWGANRVCRDYYDLWWILGRKNLTNSDIQLLLDRKSTVKGVTYESYQLWPIHNSLFTNPYSQIPIPIRYSQITNLKKV